MVFRSADDSSEERKGAGELHLSRFAGYIL